MTPEEKQSIYADTLPIVRQCIEALAGADERNDTRAGRLLLELKWMEQEIREKRLPLPLIKIKGIPTIRYALADAQFPQIEQNLDRLVAQLYYGYPPIDREHYPELKGSLDDFITAFSSVPVTPGSREALILREAAIVRDRVAEQNITLPLNSEDFPTLYAAVTRKYASERHHDLIQLYSELSASLVDGFAPMRPRDP